jgi:hypothetical protein
VSKSFTFEQAVAAIERMSDQGLPRLQDNLREYFADRPDDLVRLEAIMAPRLTRSRRIVVQPSRPTSVPSVPRATSIGRSDVLAAIEEYRKNPNAFLQMSGAREPKWVYLVDRADPEQTRYPLKAIGLYLLRSEARDRTTNDVEREIGFESLGFDVVRSLSRSAPQGHTT